MVVGRSFGHDLLTEQRHRIRGRRHCFRHHVKEDCKR